MPAQCHFCITELSVFYHLMQFGSNSVYPIGAI